MVIDFGFIKEIMMEQIHSPCDHGLILYKDDDQMLGQIGYKVDAPIGSKAYWVPHDGIKLYLMDAVPTAENLAEHWYKRLDNAILAKAIAERWYKQPSLVAIRVWETPNCLATYPHKSIHHSHSQGAPYNVTS